MMFISVDLWLEDLLPFLVMSLAGLFACPSVRPSVCLVTAVSRKLFGTFVKYSLIGTLRLPHVQSLAKSSHTNTNLHTHSMESV